MKVRYISSACVLVEHAGKRVLCDPWLTDGIYYGSWYHFPPLSFRPEDFSDVDYLYISHIHPDHLDAATLRRLPKTIPVLIHDYAEKFLLEILQRLGFTKIIEIPNGSRVELAPQFAMESYAADNCDPLVCGKFLGCQYPRTYNQTVQIDSLAVFVGGGKTVVNMNDCPYALAHTVCDRIREKYGSVDLALLGYGGAGEYPQCFEGWDEATLLERARAKRHQFLIQTLNFIRHLQPIQFMPFAGKYILGGNLAGLNRFRGIPEIEELPQIFGHLLPEHGLTSKMILLNSGESFDLTSGSPSAPFIPPDPRERQRYAQEVLSKKKYPYQEEFHIRNEERDDLMPRLQQGLKRMQRYQDSSNYHSPWRVYLDPGEENLYCIPFDGSEVTKVPPGSEQEPFVRIRLDYSLLNMILNRKAHWNNAVIGSHLRFYRKPEVYERGIHHFISYLHC